MMGDGGGGGRLPLPSTYYIHYCLELDADGGPWLGPGVRGHGVITTITTCQGSDAPTVLSRPLGNRDEQRTDCWGKLVVS